MINLSDELVIIVDSNQLASAVAGAIVDAQKTLSNFYAPGRYVSSLEITSSRDNKFKSLAFNKYISVYDEKYDAKWVADVFSIVHRKTGDSILIEHQDICSTLNIVEQVPVTLAKELWRGLRIFLLALWSRNAILLPMTFSLPASSRGREYACSLYTEVLAIYRKPFVMETDLNDVPNFLNRIRPRGLRNFDWYAWRPVIASNWHNVEDIAEEDIINLFKELTRRKYNLKNIGNFPRYPLSPSFFLGPLVEELPDRCRFDTKKISIHNPRPYQSPSLLVEEEQNLKKFELANQEIREVWIFYQSRYLKQLKEVKRIKTIVNDEKALGYLNAYLFTTLPKNGFLPPLPPEFDRRYLEGIGVPPLRDVLTRRDDFSHVERFFRFLEEIETFESKLSGFRNPILTLDKPRERGRRQTAKKTLRINDFRLFYELCHAIGEFSWYVAKNIAEGTAPSEWYDILKDKNNNIVINAEDFGFVPIIRTKKIDGSPIYVNLFWLPVTVFPSSALHLKRFPQAWTYFPTLHAIHELIVAIETGLRHIHIRWLDKERYIAAPMEANDTTFEFIVNTDKTRGEWIRPTSREVLVVLERQLVSQSWIEGGHFEDELYYDYHELSDFGKFKPLFIRYDSTKVYSEDSFSQYFKSFVYFFNQIKVSLSQSPTDALPAKIIDLNFDCRDDFVLAARVRKEFKTERTPHLTRASVVSVNAPLLPPHIIGSRVTGHLSENMVKYYTVVDNDYIENVKSIKRDWFFGDGSFNEEFFALRADNEFSNLRRAIASVSISDVLKDYGGFSFVSEDKDGNINSGMTAILSVGVNAIKLHPTHLCPLNNKCPPEIVNSIGRMSCGQCHYSVKLIDHLPRILAQCRLLSRQFDHMKKQLSFLADGDSPEEVLESLEEKILHITGEISAWAVTAGVLAKNYNNLKGKPLINSPELFFKKISELRTPDSELENLLVQCEEAIAYPELADSSLEADVGVIRSRLLAMTNSVEELFIPLDKHGLLDNFRGILRGVCLLTGYSLKDLNSYLDSPFDGLQNVIKLLEKFDE